MKKTVKILFACTLVLIGLFLFLIAPRMTDKPDMSGLQGVKFAHRGYFDNDNNIPENSLLSFEKAIENGYGIELDVQLSSDGVPMVFHDADMERMTGNQGKVWEYTCRQLQSMQLMGTDQTIPTLEQAMELIDGRTAVIVEHKMDRVDTTVCEKSYEVLSDYSGVWCMKSFDPRAVMWYRQNAPQVVRGQLAQEYWKVDKFKGDPLYTALSFLVSNVVARPDFISYHHQDADNISLKLCRLMGADIACWTLKSDEDYAQAKGKFDMYVFDSFDINKAE